MAVCSDLKKDMLYSVLFGKKHVAVCSDLKKKDMLYSVCFI